MQVKELPHQVQPKSQTIKLTDHWKDDNPGDAIDDVEEDELDIDDL